ncbi:hypothetical protein B6U80_00810 [Candidatus Pacearchaeota archaeon ex4484_26]|nr:MAG: hypothetical protein B6U80_00810 [Candidatus Pacearchaeota archaeon ex4484_26]
MPYPYPILFKIGPLNVYTFGFFMLIASLIALWLALRRRGKVAEEHIYNLAIISLVAGVIGARISFFVLAPQYLHSFFDFIAIWQGGMGFFGGFVLALILDYIYIKMKHLNFWQIADIFAPSIALAIAITRIGGFIAGVNPGLPTNLPWAILYNGLPTHPAALYHAFANFTIFLILIFSKKKLKERFLPGYLFLFFVLLYGVERFALDFFRAYDALITILAARTVWPLLVVVSAYLLWLRKRKKKFI